MHTVPSAPVKTFLISFGGKYEYLSGHRRCDTVVSSLQKSIVNKYFECISQSVFFFNLPGQNVAAAYNVFFLRKVFPPTTSWPPWKKNSSVGSLVWNETVRTEDESYQLLPKLCCTWWFAYQWQTHRRYFGTHLTFQLSKKFRFARVLSAHANVYNFQTVVSVYRD